MKNCTNFRTTEEIRNQDISRSHNLGIQKTLLEKVVQHFATWKECQLTEFHAMHYMQGSKDRETREDQDCTEETIRSMRT